MKSDLEFTDTQLVEMFGWPCFNGFTADSCGECKSTANVPTGPGWFCRCGAFNVLPLSDYQIPHSAPVYGPSHERILAAVQASRRLKS